MDPTQSRVIDQIYVDEIVGLASELIKIPSFKLEETPVATFLAEFFGKRGYKVDLQEVEPGRFQTIATLEGTGGGPSLMLNGHTDINSLTRRWRRDPWIPVVEGDRLYGHGVQNMKGGLASIIMAAEAVRTSGVRLKGDLVVACVVGETQGGEGTNYLMATGFRTDMAVVAEPFGAGNLVTVHSGIVHMAVHTYGVTGHVRQLEGTVNAVAKMTGIIDALQRVEFTYQPREDLPGLPKLNVGSVIGGLGQDYVLVEPPYIPDLCTIIVDVHFLPGQTVDGIVAPTAAVATTAAAVSANLPDNAVPRDHVQPQRRRLRQSRHPAYAGVRCHPERRRRYLGRGVVHGGRRCHGRFAGDNHLRRPGPDIGAIEPERVDRLDQPGDRRAQHHRGRSFRDDAIRRWFYPLRDPRQWQRNRHS